MSIRRRAPADGSFLAVSLIILCLALWLRLSRVS